MKFELNKADNLVKSLISAHGEPVKLTSTFSFTPTGIGTRVKLKLESELFNTEKDITDYIS